MERLQTEENPMSSRRFQSRNWKTGGTLLELLEERTLHIPECSCWIWDGTLDKDGYGKLNIHGKNHMAHRVSYEIFIGQIPEKKVIDHLCRNRCCVNPRHMEVVTSRENTVRGVCHHRQQTHCDHGHLFDLKNTHVTKMGVRHCRTCDAARQRRYRAAKRRP